MMKHPEMISCPMMASDFAYKIIKKDKKKNTKSILELLKINEIKIQKKKR